jgi:hypothetical protein
MSKKIRKPRNSQDKERMRHGLFGTCLGQTKTEGKQEKDGSTPLSVLSGTDNVLDSCECRHNPEARAFVMQISDRKGTRVS